MVKFIRLLLLASFLCSFEHSNGLQVLGILPFESRSHHAIGQSIMLSLAEFFHNVTVVSPYPVKKPLYFYDEVSLESEFYDGDFIPAEVPSVLDIADIPIMSSLRFLYESGEDTVNYLMTHPNFKALIESGRTYNACIIENSHFEALMGLAEIFQCVLITYTTYPSVHLIDRMTSNISPPSFVPNSLLEFSHVMTFKQRFVNTVNTLFEKIFYEFLHLPNQKRLYQRYFPNAHNTFEDANKNSSIVFINNNVVASSPRPYLPNMIDIGGIHVTQPKPLKKKLKKFLDASTNGVVFFSMGSIMQGTEWEEEERNAFINAFAKLKQKVLWKYENETLPNRPENVKFGKWFPQNDILAHPNVKLFITHGGLLSMTEAIIHGVPVLVVPMFGDQKMNAANAVAHGFGLRLSEGDITEAKISKKLEKLLTNSKYAEKAKTMSSRFKDKPITPKLSVIYWTNYAVRHKGARHLRVPADHLNFLQLLSIDVLLFMIALLVSISVIFLKILRKLFATSGVDK